MFSSAKAYLPAAGRDWLLPLYDPVVKLLGTDIARRALLDQAKVQAGHRVPDIGCGTGSFATLIKEFHPDFTQKKWPSRTVGTSSRSSGRLTNEAPQRNRMSMPPSLLHGALLMLGLT
jgi:hypothetical protein